MTARFASIVRYELRVLFRDGVLAIVLVVFVAAAIAAFVNGSSRTSRQADIADTIRQDEVSRFEHVTERLRDIEAGRYVATDPYEDPSRPSIAGGWMAYRFAVAPPAPLAALAIGQTDLRASYLGVTIWSTIAPSWLNRRVLVGESEIENPANLAAGPFDLTFVVVFLLPLAIILLTHGLVADDRDEGTLGLIAAQPVSQRALFAAKLVARTIPIAALWSVLAGMCLAVAAGSGSGDAYARAAAWLVATVAYCGFWCALGAYIASLPGDAGAAAVRLATTWLLLVFVGPAGLNALTAWVAPLPDRVALVQQARGAQLDVERANTALAEAFYAREPNLRPHDAPPDVRRYAATTLFAQHAEVERRLAPNVRAFESQAERQNTVAERIGMWSPATAMTAALVDAAGSGPDRHRHFTKQVRAFRSAWRAYFVPRLFRLERIGANDVAQFPRFRFAEEPEAIVAMRVLGRLPVVGVATLLLLWRAWTRAAHLQVLH